MSKGYLLFALDTNDVDYTRLAYACALSIKITQPKEYNSVSLITNNPNKDNLRKVFDHVIEYNGPSGMDARSRAFDYTPYDETILLDADMLLMRDMSHYWNIMETKDLFISTCAKTYRGDRIKYGFYRKVFEENKLPDVYNAWTYFKKNSSTSKDFFETVKLITDYPKTFIQNLSNYKSSTIPTDEAFALAIGILGLDKEVICEDWDFPSITHMKGMVQNWANPSFDWTEKIRFNLNENGQIILGVWPQFDLLHYVDKDIISDSIIKILEEKCFM